METNHTYKEKPEWISEDKVRLETTESIPMKNGKGELIGVHEQKLTVEARYEDLEQNYNERMNTYQRLANQVADINRKMNAIGKKPAMTAELARLKENFLKLQKIDQLEQLEKQKANLEEQMRESEAWLNERRKTLNSRPKKEDEKDGGDKDGEKA